MAEGYVYILTNRYVPDLVKIGYTDRDPDARANELSNTTGVPGKWIVHKSWLLEDAYSWEQRLFSNLSKYRETGEFFRLSSQNAGEKVSALLASWGAINASGLSAAARRESERIKAVRAREETQIEEERRKRQTQQDRMETAENAVKLLQQVAREMKEKEKAASNLIYEKWEPWFRENQIKKATIWGIGILIVSWPFVPKQEGAFVLAGIAALFAYMVGDNRHSDEFQIPLREEKQVARNAVLQSHQLGYLADESKIVTGYRDYRGFTVESLDNWEHVNQQMGYKQFDGPQFKNKQSGEIIGERGIVCIEEIGYFDKSSARLLV